MKTIVAITFALTLMCGAAFAQNTRRASRDSNRPC